MNGETLTGLLKKGQMILAQAGIKEAGLDAWLLLEYVTGKSRAYYFAYGEESVTESVAERYLELISRRAGHIPLQHLTHQAFFMGHEFYVDKNVLVPRQDTETLVESALECMKAVKNPYILDMCTGSGCILISILKERADAHGTGVDLSDEALKVAVRNARTLEVAEHAEFVQSNLFSEMQNIVYGTEYMKRTAVKDTVKMTECENSNRNYSRAYDMIISNPPYIPTAEIEDLMDEVKLHDPRMALDGMEDAFNDGKVQYGLPYQSNVQGFFYNKDLFDKAGIAYPTDDTTYDEFLDMIAKLKDSGVTPIAIGSKNSGYSMWEFNEFFSRYGWEDNEKSYTGDKAKYSNDDMNACFEKIKGLADAGAFPENMATIEYFDAKQLFNEGKAAMFGTGQWDCAEFDKNIGEHIGFWWGPKFEDSSYEQNIAMKVPAAPLVVSSAVKDNDKAKEAVYAFLKYYYGEEAAKISYEGSIFPATNYDGIAATDSQYAMNAMITALGNGWKTPKAAPDQTVTPAVQEAMYDAIFGVMQGTYSPKDALKNMDSAAAN